MDFSRSISILVQPPSHRSNNRGFSLIEILVATVVLVLILLMGQQIMEQTLRATSVSSRKIDSTASARIALDAMDADIRQAVIDSGSTVLIANSAASSLPLALVTRRRGPAEASEHRYLYVSYELDDSGNLWRRLRSADFDDLDLLQVLANMTRGQDPPIAIGVLKCAIRVHSGRGEFFAETASNHPGAWTANHPGGPHPGYLALLSEKSPHLDDVRSGVSSIEVWIAVLDSSAAAVLQQTGQWEALETFLPDAQPETWDVRINDMTSLPGLARESFRVLRKQIPIP